MDLTNSRRRIASKLSTPEPPRLLYYFVKLIGLAPFTLKNNRFHPPTLLDLLYSIAVGVAHFLFVITAILFALSAYSSLSYSESAKKWALARYVISLPVTFSTLAMITVSHKKIVDLMNRLCDASNELDSLSIMENPRRMFNKVTVTTAIVNSIFIATVVALCLMEPNWHMILRIQHAIGTCFALNVVWIYVQVLSCIRQRFALLNVRLSTIFVRNLGTPATQRRLIRRIEALHLELSELVDQTSDIFAVPVLLNSLQFFGVLVLSSDFVHSIVSYSTLPHCSPEIFTSLVFPYIRSPLLKITIAVVEILMIAHTSATTAKEGNSTRDVLNKTWLDSEPSAEFDDEFFMFSIQLADKPVAVSSLGLFNLDYSYVYKMFSAVVTYLIIAMQFRIDASNLAILRRFKAHGCVVSQ